MMKVVVFQNVSKTFRDKILLEKTDLVLREGQLNVVSGEGKTAFLKLVAGVETCDEGSINVLDGDPFDFDFKDRSDIFFIHENYQLFFPLNLLETIKCYRSVFPRWSNENFNSMLNERRFSLRKNYSELNHSQKMELLVMMALAARPKILLINNLSAFMDEKAQEYFLPLLKKYTSFGGTVILSSSNPSEFSQYADQFIVLENKNIILNRGIGDEEKLVA